MRIVLHLGSSIKAYRERGRWWRPPQCVCVAASDLVSRHSAYGHGVEPGNQETIRVWRFRGKGCRKVFSVLPDLLLPHCTYPAEVRDQAVIAYVRGEGTYGEIAARFGVAKSTVWRWVHQLGRLAARWLLVALAQLRLAGLPDGPVLYRHELRALFIRRRVRLAGMLEALLVIEALVGWVERLRQGMLHAGKGPLACGLHGFCWHVLEPLAAGVLGTGPPHTRDGTACSPRGG
jgi:hypothetical protein